MTGEKRGDDDAFKIERPTTTLKELALDKLRDAILGFHFQPGERLVERRLAQMLGVSRTVVREVLRHLEAEGLVETLAYQGPVVARLDIDTVDQIYELRTIIEVLATRACAERITDRELASLERTLQALEHSFQDRELVRALEEATHFYAIIFTCAGKTVAWDVFRNLNARVNQLRAMTLASVAGSRPDVGETRRIVQAIRQRDPDAAERACRAHVQYAHEIARHQLMALQEN